jgi:hypothetical protein
MRLVHAESDAPESASGPARRRARTGAVEEPMVERTVTTSPEPRTQPTRLSRAEFAEPIPALFERELAEAAATADEAREARLEPATALAR